MSSSEPLREPTLSEEERLARVRAVLTGDLSEKVEALERRLDGVYARVGTNEASARLVSEYLPQAVTHAYGPRTREDFETALSDPWIGAARFAAENRLDAATNALSPLMLPAIAQGVKERLDAFSKALNRASPTRRIGWKIKSLQTGLPLESVMAQDLDPFRVHRVLAVEMPAGNLLANVRAPNEDGSPPQTNQEDESFATAALLTALRGFVRDARIGDETSELSSIEVGRRTFHIAQQGSIMIAVEASGELAHDLESSMHAELFPAMRAAKTQTQREHALSAWREDRPESSAAQGSGGMRRGVVFCALALMAALWFSHRWVERNDVQHTVARLMEIPGVASASAVRDGAKWRLWVAADPLADLSSAFEKTLTPQDKLNVKLDPVVSLDAVSVSKSIAASLPVPQGANVVVEHHAAVREVRVSGRVSGAYVEALRAHPRVQLGNFRVVVASGTALTP